MDWEENLRLASEAGRGKATLPGDGGLVAHILDAAGQAVLLTDERWKAQTFYIAPAGPGVRLAGGVGPGQPDLQTTGMDVT